MTSLRTHQSVKGTPVLFPKKLLVFLILALGLQLTILSEGGWATEIQKKNQACRQEGLITLLPGTFNSWMPSHPDEVFEHKHYFAEIIPQTFKALGFSVLIIDSLLPTGEIHRNGEIAFKKLNKYYKTHCPKEGAVPIHLIGHSAGGLYGLSVLHQNKELPIKSLFMIATPLQGMTLADAVFDNPATSLWLENLIESATPYFDGRGLPALQTKRVEDFLKSIQIPEGVALWSIIGEQPPPPTTEEWQDARYLNPLFAAIDHLIGGGSDGVIDRLSALGLKAEVPTRGGKMTAIKTYSETMALDHLEQILDWRIVDWFGYAHARSIETEQSRFYKNLGMRILNDHH